jgi:hypothetical protein
MVATPKGIFASFNFGMEELSTNPITGQPQFLLLPLPTDSFCKVRAFEHSVVRVGSDGSIFRRRFR